MPSKSASKKSGWKAVQSKAKVKKRTKLAIGVLVLVGGLLLLSWVVQFTQTLFSPVQASYHKNYRWDGDFNINLVVKQKTISIFSYNPKETSIAVFNLPDETFVTVPNGFGNWQLGAVYGLGGDKLLVDTLTSYLAIPIDGFLDLGSQKQKPQNILSGFNFISGLKTNLTMWELLKLKLGVRAVRFDKITELNLDKLNVLDRQNLPDGTPVFTTDSVKLDSVLINLADPVIAQEHKSIAVLNATDQPQLAGKWARLITNLGGNVIITANAKARLKSTQVIGKDSLTLKRLKQIFELDCQKNPKCGKISFAEEDLVYQRAEIIVLLGEDFANK